MSEQEFEADRDEAKFGKPPTMTASDTDRLTETWSDKHWPVFHKHHPVGAYLPVGQLDGDCSCGHGSWPCEEAAASLDALLIEQGERIAVEIEKAALARPKGDKRIIELYAYGHAARIAREEAHRG